MSIPPLRSPTNYFGRSPALCKASGASYALVARNFGCFRRTEPTRPRDQPLQSRYSFPKTPQFAFEHIQPLIRPGLQQEHQAAQGCAHAKNPDQLCAHAISLAVEPLARLAR